MHLEHPQLIFWQPEWRHGLVPLPRDYTDLMNLSANFSCSNSVTGESKTPALCLVCGAMVCSHSHCCEALLDGHRCGGCTAHARTCGADIGIFLRIRECIVVIHSKVTRGESWKTITTDHWIRNYYNVFFRNIPTRPLH